MTALRYLGSKGTISMGKDCLGATVVTRESELRGLRRNEARDAGDRPKAVDFQVLERHSNTELRFQLRQEFHEGQGVNEARVDQVGLHRRHFDVQLLGEEPAKLVLEVSRIRHVRFPGARLPTGRTASDRTVGRRYSDTAAAARCT